MARFILDIREEPGISMILSSTTWGWSSTLRIAWCSTSASRS
jgi:hypothetical protein